MVDINSKVDALMTGRRPDFMIIGAMKSGTTTLYQYLDRHPGIFMSSPKEPMFFSREDIRSRGLDWYFSLFRDARTDQICGEASTCYSRWPYYGDVAARIHDAVPNAKFIYVMRHPVERAYSHYRHEMESRVVHGYSGRKIITFERSLEDDPVIFETSLYRRQIGKFLDHFPQDRFLLLFFEELTNDPASTLLLVQKFLGLDPQNYLLESEVVANQFGSVRAKVDALKFVNFVRQIPGVSTVKRYLPPHYRALIHSRLRRFSAANIATRHRIKTLEKQISPLETSVRQQLLQRFSAANRELEQLMGRQVPSSWHT